MSRAGVVHPIFSEQVAAVGSDSKQAQAQSVGDVLAGAAVGDGGQHLLFAAREQEHDGGFGSDLQQQALHLVAKKLFASENLSNGFGQLFGQGDFEHVAGGTALQHAHNVALFVENGNGQIFQAGMLGGEELTKINQTVSILVARYIATKELKYTLAVSHPDVERRYCGRRRAPGEARRATCR